MSVQVDSIAEGDDVWAWMSFAPSCETTVSTLDEKPSSQISLAPVFSEHSGQLRRVDYQHQLDYDLFQSRIRMNHPVVITNFVALWPAVEKWKSIEYLQQLVAHDPAMLVLESKDNLHFFKNELTHHHHLSGEAAVHRVFVPTSDQPNATKWYARAEFQQDFLRDVLLPTKILYPPGEDHTNQFQLPLKQKTSTVWMSTAGNITPLHYDLCHGFLCQVVGTKKVTLFHKDDFRSLYKNASTHCNKTASRLIPYAALRDGDAELRKRFPKVLDLTPIEVILQPGEFLYIPPFWWHHVETLTPSVSVLIPFDMSADEPIHPCCFL